MALSLVTQFFVVILLKVHYKMFLMEFFSFFSFSYLILVPLKYFY